MLNTQLAFKCLACGDISVFPSRKADGNRCLACDSQIVPFGWVHLAKGTEKQIHISVNINGADEFKSAMERVFKELNTIPPVEKNAF